MQLVGRKLNTRSYRPQWLKFTIYETYFQFDADTGIEETWINDKDFTVIDTYEEEGLVIIEIEEEKWNALMRMNSLE